LEEQDYSQAAEAILNQVRSSRQKWRIKTTIKPDRFPSRALVNEETGQVIYYLENLEKLNDNPLVISPQVNKARENHITMCEMDVII